MTFKKLSFVSRYWYMLSSTVMFEVRLSTVNRFLKIELYIIKN